MWSAVVAPKMAAWGWKRLIAANAGHQMAYGDDDLMAEVREGIRRVFEAPEAAVYLVARIGHQRHPRQERAPIGPTDAPVRPGRVK